MPSIDIEFLKQLKNDYYKYPNFIETGTLKGETTFVMEPYFDKLYTIEISEYYYNNTVSNYNKNNKITFILGDSSIVFQTLLPTIDSPSIFFLDGHWSSGDTGRGLKDCPLLEEVTHINNYFKPECIIIIDDHRLFGLGPDSKILNENWTEINDNNIINIVDKRISNIYYLDSECAKNDRMIIHLNKLG